MGQSDWPSCPATSCTGKRVSATSLDVFEDVPSPITGIGSNTLDAWLTCQIAEIICYQKALGIDGVRSLDAYLCQRYGLKP